MWMGEDENTPDGPLFGNLVKEIHILGVSYSLDRILKDDLNYKEILREIKKMLVWWKHRDLTIMGKIHLLKTSLGALKI